MFGEGEGTDSHAHAAEGFGVDWSHFGMTRRPFRPAVDAGAYFPAAAHEAARVAVAGAFARRDPVVLIDGPAGVGKSLVARVWLERLPAAVPRVFLPNTHAARPADLHQAILFDLNQPYRGLSDQELRLAVTDQLLSAATAGQPTVLLIDEAQLLGPAVLEELRLLGNIETTAGSALFLVLVAHPRFRDGLAQPECEAFAQRVGVRCRVEPFTAAESAAYLMHQVTAAGGTPGEVFEGDAVALLTSACGGVARLLNRAATTAAELAAGAGAEIIDVEAAMEAVAALGLESKLPGEPDEPTVLPHPGPGRAKPAARGPKAKTARKRSA